MEQISLMKYLHAWQAEDFVGLKLNLDSLVPEHVPSALTHNGNKHGLDYRISCMAEFILYTKVTEKDFGMG